MIFVNRPGWARTLLDGVLGRVGGRADVLTGAANGVTRRHHQAAADQGDSYDLAHHDIFSRYQIWGSNRAAPTIA